MRERTAARRLSAVDRGWWKRVWLPAARNSLRPRRTQVGSRWWPVRVIFARAVACRAPEPSLSEHGGYGWTCQRPLWHGGAHRFRNYVWWSNDRHAHYAPLPVHGQSVVTW